MIMGDLVFREIVHKMMYVIVADDISIVVFRVTF